MTHAHTLVTQACLGILLHLDENITRDSLTKFPLAEYAGRHWVEHARFEDVAENAEEGMKRLFDGSNPYFAVWLWIYNPIRRPFLQMEMPLRPLGTPLHYAAFCGLHTVVNFLAIKHSEDIHSRHVDDNSTPLHLASREGHVDAARILVGHGADVTVQDKSGWSPLHQASARGHVELARILVGHGTDVTAQDKSGWSPLHQALARSHVELAQILVGRGADVTAQDNDGRSPLHEASAWGNVELAQILVGHGADVTAQDKFGRSPLQQALARGHGELAQLLMEHSTDATA